MFAHRQIRDAISIDVAHRRHGRAKRAPSAGERVCRGPSGPIGVHAKQVHGGTSLSSISASSNRQIRQTVAVEVPHRCHPSAERHPVFERRATAGIARDLLHVPGRPFGLRNRQVYVTPVTPSGAISLGPGRQIGHAVAVQVLQCARGNSRTGHRGSKGPPPLPRPTFLRTFDGAIGMHEQNVNCAEVRVGIAVSRIIKGGSDRQIRHAVAVQVAHARYGSPKMVLVRQRRTAADGAGNLGCVSGRAVRIHQQHIHGAAVAAARVVPVGSNRQVGHAVSVQIAQRGHGAARIRPRRPAWGRHRCRWRSSAS